VVYPLSLLSHTISEPPVANSPTSAVNVSRFRGPPEVLTLLNGASQLLLSHDNSANSTVTLYTVNVTTGALTAGRLQRRGHNATGDSTFGLAQDTPEPVTSLLTLTGLAGVLSLRRGQERSAR
jgi:hypothetical protein